MLRKALKIMEKRLQVLKVPKVPIVKCAEVPSSCQTGAEVLSRCRGAEVPGCWVPALTPLDKYI